MREPPWKSLATALRRAGERGEYVDRVDARLGGATASHEALERELVAEMAAALGRAEHKVEAALERLAAAGRALDAAPDDSGLRAVWNACREAALRARWELLVHREAVGIRRNDVLETLYPIPPRRR